MEKKEYFKQLVKLFEDVGMAGSEEVVPQEKIADNGKDVSFTTNVAPKEEVVEKPITDEEVDNFEDQNMFGEIPTGSSDVDVVMKSQKLKKLFSLFEDLLTYATLFLDSLSNIDYNLLELEVYKIVSKYTNNTKELIDKVNNYMTNIFTAEEYEKILYVYILFRTELVANIKGIRDILKLNKPDEELK